MKRVRSKTGDRPDTLVYDDGAPLERQPGRECAIALLTPPESPERFDPPSKFRRHGSKLMSVLRSLTNSGKHLTTILCNIPHLLQTSRLNNTVQYQARLLRSPDHPLHARVHRPKAVGSPWSY
jgi:hypothetical protein